MRKYVVALACGETQHPPSSLFPLAGWFLRNSSLTSCVQFLGKLPRSPFSPRSPVSNLAFPALHFSFTITWIEASGDVF